MQKNHFLRRGLAMLLAFVLVAGFLTPARAADTGSELTFGIEKINNDSVSAKLPMNQAGSGSQSLLAQQDPDEIVRVSIQLEKASTMEAGFRLNGISRNAGAMSYRNTLKRNQQTVIAAIEYKVLKNQKLDVVWNLTLAANVISANVPRSAIAEIEKLDGVRCVVEEKNYEPQVASIGGKYEPNKAISGEMTGSHQSWLSGYTGAGMRVAIIDTGLDTDHQSFAEDAFLHAIAETGKTCDLLDPAEIATVLPQLNAYARQAEAGVTITAEDLYINAKAAFGYNYIDGNFDVTHDNDSMGEHGSHVAGIAAANRFIAKDGSFVDAVKEVCVAGNAPDAQILTMKVFGAEGGAYDSDIMAAIEDALLLGADAINLSIGSPLAGRTYSEDPLYEELFARLEKTNTVVSISGGNYGHWAQNTYHGYLFNDDVNFATGGTPGTYANSLSVASVDNDGDYCGDLSVGGHTFGYLESLGDGYVEYGNTSILTMDTSADGTGTDYEFVFIDGLGLSEDYEGMDLTGKVVFVSRGELSFLEKANNAAALGAAAVVVYNNQPGIIYMDLTGLQHKIPVVAIVQSDAALVKAAATAQTTENGTAYYTGTVTVVGKIRGHYSDSQFKNISIFSSWGVPSNLVLKPEITAPGGNIYSVNGVDPSGTGYELMSGTSMAAPQVAGMSALLLQYLQENGIKAQGLTDRALAQSLLMGTAEPLIDGNSGCYYPVLQQGSGLGNVNDAMNSPVYITVEGQDDGKVKAELGDDADRTGVYTFSFDLNNLTDEMISYQLDADAFTQKVFESEEAIRYLDTETRLMDAAVEFSVNGRVLASAYDMAGYDFNGDGKINNADAQLLLCHVTKGTALIANAENADISGDGVVGTYDVHLFLSLYRSAVEVPANGSVTVKVTIRLSDAEKAALNELNPCGAYVQAFVFAQPMVTAEGVVMPTLSIPVLGFYGGWHEASMFDETCYTTYFTGEEEREPYWATSYVNGVGAVFGDDNTVKYYFGGNPIVSDSRYMPERNAINLERGDYFRGWDFGLIRNAGAHRAVVTNTTTGEELFYEEGGAVNAAYYYEALGGWMNVPQTFVLDFAPDMKEGERGLLSFSTVVELYADDWSKADTMEMPFVVDNTAPVIAEDSVVVDTEKNVLRLTVSDNQYVAGVTIYDVTGRNLLAYCGADQEAPAGSTVTMEVPLDEVEGYKFIIQVVDYAVNKTTYKLKHTIGDPGPMPEMLYYSPTFQEWEIGSWPESVSQLVSYEGWFDSTIDVQAATAVGSYVYMVDGDQNLYAAPGDNLFEVAKVCSLDYQLSDMTYDRENGIIYAIYAVDKYDSMLISIDRMTGMITEIGKFATGYYAAATLAYAGNGQFYTTSDSNSPNLYTFTLTDGEIGKVTQVGYMNPYSSGYDCLEYNPADGMLYFVSNNSYSGSSTSYELNRIDPQNPTNGSYVKSDYRYFYGEVTTLIFPDWSDEANDWFNPSGEVSAVTLNKSAVEVFTGKTFQLVAGVSPWNTEDRSVVFSSADESVATVNSKGLVTGISEGTTVITATSVSNPAVKAECTVTVSVLDVTIEGILVDADESSKRFSWNTTSPDGWVAGTEMSEDALAATLIPGEDAYYMIDPNYATRKVDLVTGEKLEGPYTYMPTNYYYPHGIVYSAQFSTAEAPMVYYVRNGQLTYPRKLDGTNYVSNFSFGYDHDYIAAACLAGTEIYNDKYNSDVVYLIDDLGNVFRANVYVVSGSYYVCKYSKLPSTLPAGVFAAKEFSSMVLGDDGALYVSAINGKTNVLYRLAYNADEGVYEAMELGEFGENVWPAIVLKASSNAPAVTAVPEATLEATVVTEEPTAEGGLQAIKVTDTDAVVDGGTVKADCAEGRVTVPVYAVDSTNGLVELRYDSSLMTLISADTGAVMTCVDTSEEGVVRIGYADAAAVDALIANLVFAVETEETVETELVLDTQEDCDQFPETEETEALTLPGHSFVDVVTPPTTEEQGYTTHTCEHCGYSFVDSFVDPIPEETEPETTEPETTEPEETTKPGTGDNVQTGDEFNPTIWIVIMVVALAGAVVLFFVSKKLDK